jgi:hypothetical protein
MGQQLRYYVEMLKNPIIIKEISLEENMSMSRRKPIQAYLSIKT